MPFGFSRRNAVRQHNHKSRRNAPKRRRLFFDALEDRRLLSAGTVETSPAQTFAVASYPPGNTAPSNTLDPATVAWTSNHAVAMDSNGDAVVVWDDSPTNPTTHQVTGQWALNFQTYTDNGTTLTPGIGGPLTYKSNGSAVVTNVGSPWVAMAPTSGDFVVVWQTQSTESWSNGSQVASTYAQLYSDTQGPLTDPILVGKAGQAQPWGVAMGDNGFDVLYGASPQSKHVIFTDNYQVATVARYSSTGASLGTTSLVDDADYNYTAAIAADPAGNFVVGWENSTSGSSGTVYSLNWQRFTSAGAAEESAQQEITQDFPGSLNLAMDASDDFVMSWFDGQFSNAPKGLAAQTVYANDTLGYEQLVDGSVGGDRTAIAMQPGGNYALSWYDPSASSYSPNPYTVYAATYALDGTPETAPFVVYSPPAVTVNGKTHGLDHTASAAFDPSGNLLTINAGYYADGSSTVYTDGGEFGQLYLEGSQAPQPASQFAVSVPANVTVNVPFNATVTAEDANGNTVSSFPGTTVSLTDINGALVGSPVTVNLTNGVGTAQITLSATGSDKLTASGADPSTGNTLTGSSALTVYGQARQFVFSPTATTAGAPMLLTVTAEDANGDLAGAYTGIVQLSTSDAKAMMQSKAILTNGVATFEVILKTAGNQTITATDGSITSTGTIAVSAAAASQIILSAPSSAASGTAFNVNITFEDAYGNVVAGPGTVQVTSAGGTTTANVVYDSNGVGTFSLTLTNTNRHHRPQQQTVTVTAGSLSSSFKVTVN